MTTTQLKEFAQLAQASYAYFDSSDIGNAARTRTKLQAEGKGEFAEREAQLFTDRFELLHQSRDQFADLGFSASLFRDESDGRLIFSVRGTEFIDAGAITTDFLLADLRIGIDGYASTQAVPLYRYMKQLMTAAGQLVIYTDDELDNLVALSKVDLSVFQNPSQFIADFKQSLRADRGVDAGQGAGALIPSGTTVDVTGHSLGGHLAILLERLFPSVINSVTTFNAPGFDATGGNSGPILSKFSSGWTDRKITRVEAFGDNVHEIGTRFPGSSIGVGQENDPGIAASFISNHSVVNSTDGLALAELMGKIDSRFASNPSLVRPLVDAAAAVPKEGYENVLDEMRRLFIGPEVLGTQVNEGTSPASRNALYENIENLTALISPNGANGQYRIESLIGKDASSLAGLAKNGDIDARAYRFALKEANQFSILGADYNAYNQNGELNFFDSTTGAGRLTTDWLDDRAKFLFWKNAANTQDVTAVRGPNGPDNWQYFDAAQNYTISVKRQVLGSDSAAPFRKAIFDSDESHTVEGGTQADRLYGNGGTDTFIGGLGNDYLEGGTGFDDYLFASGDGKDTILDIDGSGRVSIGDRFFYNAKRIVGNGDDLWADDAAGVQFAFKPQSAGAKRGELKMTAISGKDTLAKGDSITIENFDLTAAADPNGGYMGIKFDDRKQILWSDKLEKNIFEKAVENVGKAVTGIAEGAAHTLNIMRNAAAEIGQKLRIEADADFQMPEQWAFILGDDTVSFAGGTLDIALDPGQSQTVLSLVNKGDIDQDFTGRLKVTLIGADGQAVTNADGSEVSDTLTVNFDATDEPGTPQATNLIVGDQDPQSSDYPNDNLYGTAGNDELRGLTGNDTLRGREGDDILDGGTGRNSMFGELGNDLIKNAGNSDDVADGGEGDDQLFAGAPVTDFAQAIDAGASAAGSDLKGAFLGGGAGNDRIVGGADVDMLAGGLGNDLILGGGGDDYIFGDIFGLSDAATGWGVEQTLSTNADGSQYLFTKVAGATIDASGEAAGGGNDVIHAGSGNDFVLGDGGNDFISGDDGNDNLFGGDGDDTLLGGKGNDRISGDYDRIDGVAWTGSDFIDGGEGDDHLYGNRGSDTLYGGDGNDELVGDDLDNPEGAGDDYLDGEAGNDKLYGVAGNDTLYGGEGDDELVGDNEVNSTGAGDDYLDGEGGNDNLFGAAGNDTLYGGDGDDRLEGDSSQVDGALHGNDYLDGEAGNDTLIGGGGNDTLYGGDGNDLMLGDADGLDAAYRGDDYLDGEGGDDILIGNGGNDEIYGGDGNDQIFGGLGRDTLIGGEGNDSISGDEGGGDPTIGDADVIDGGAGSDSLYGQSGDDTLAGGEGDDLLRGGDGNDTLDGGDGNDLMFGDDGNDALQGGAGDDQLFGNSGDDGIDGGSGNDQLQGGAGDDTLSGGGGDDVLFGEAGNDTLDGGEGTNYLDGGAGDDILISNGASDTLVGGGGNDRFIVNGGGSVDISNEGGESVIEFANAGSLDEFTISQAADDQSAMVFEDGSGAQIVVRSALTSGNSQAFAFADGSQLDLVHVIDAMPAINLSGGGNAARNILAGGHDDLLGGSDFNDTIRAGAGNDVLAGGEGDDLLVGGAGDDFLLGGNGDDVYELASGDGADLIIDTGGVNTVRFGTGIAADSIQSFVDGDQGDLRIEYGAGATVTIAGGLTGSVAKYEFADGTSLTNDELMARSLQGESQTIVGDDSGNNLGGGSGADHIMGLGNDDRLSGGGGDDLLEGGWGDDVLIGGKGNDTLKGGEGDDTYIFNSGDGADLIDDNLGVNRIRFGAGVSVADITARVEAGADGRDHLVISHIGDQVSIVDGLQIPDTTYGFADGSVRSQNELFLTAMKGSVVATGTDGADTLYGQADDDYLAGAEGNDLLRGGAGNDVLEGGAGEDTLDGGSGNDELRGGADFDVYRLNVNNGLDTIVGETGTNRILLDSGIRLSQLRALRSGDDALVYNGAADNGMLLANYFAGDQTWYLQQEDQATLGLSSLLLNSTPVADVEAYRSAFLENLLAQAGAATFSDGTFLNAFGNSSSVDASGDPHNYHFEIQRDAISSDAAEIIASDDNEENTNQDFTYNELQTATVTLTDTTTTIQEGATRYRVVNGNPNIGGGFESHGVRSYADGNGNVILESKDPSKTHVERTTHSETVTNYIPHFSYEHSYIARIEDVTGGSSDNQIFSSGSEKLVDGGAGNDTLTDQWGSLPWYSLEWDLQTARFGDFLSGNSGDDTLIGRNERDELIGGAGSDIMNGRGGGDTYRIFANEDGQDIVIDTGSLGGKINISLMGGNGESRVPGRYTLTLDRGVDEELLRALASLPLRATDASGGSANFSGGLDQGYESNTFISDPGLPAYAVQVLSPLVPGLEEMFSDLMEKASAIQTGDGNVWAAIDVEALGSLAQIFDVGGLRPLAREALLPDPESQSLMAVVTPADIVSFEDGIRKENLVVERTADATGSVLRPALEIRWSDSGRLRVVLPGNDDAPGFGVERFKFSDGSEMTIQEMAALAPPENTGPELVTELSDLQAIQGMPFTAVVPSDAFHDAEDGYNLALSATLSNGDPLPDWLQFDPLTRTFSGTPANGDVGALEISVLATDSGGYDTADDFILTVAGENNAPIAVTDEIAVSEGANTANIAALLLSNDQTVNPGDILSIDSVDSSNAVGRVVFNAETQTLIYAADSATQKALGAGETAQDSFSYTVIDNSGATSAATVNVTVAGVNDAPRVASGLRDVATFQNAAFSYVVPGDAFADVDHSDSLSYAATLANGDALPSWLTFDAATLTFSGSPGSADVGSLVLSVVATDTGNLSASSVFTLNVADVNDAPLVGVPLGDQAVNEEAAFSYVIPADAFTDADASDTLAYSLNLANGDPLPAWLSYDAATRTLSGTPDDAQVGTLALRVSVTDEGGLSATQDFQVTVNPVNDVPVAVADTVSVAEDASTGNLAALLLANDHDADTGDVLTLKAVDASATAGTVVFDEVTQTLAYAADGASQQSLGAGQTAQDTFTYTEADASGAISTSSVSVTVTGVNDAPLVGAGTADQHTDQNAVFTFALPDDAFSDVDQGDTLTYTATLANGDALPSWLSFDPAGKIFSGTPGNGDIGTLAVQVIATDSGNLATASIFNLDVANVNDAPLADIAIGDQTTLEDAAFSFVAPQDAFKDIDQGDTLSYQAALSSGDALPAWLAFDAATRTFSGTPDNSQVGNLSIKVTATDAGGLSVAQDFALAVVNTNDAPILVNPIADQSAQAGQAFALQVPDNAFTDPDAGDTLAYSATLADGGALPSWLSFDAATLTFSGTPANLNAGDISIAVTATDGSGASMADTFNLNVQPLLDQTINGTNRNDTLTGGAGNDTLNGNGGTDTLNGLAGNDTLYGGNGADTLNGGVGDDTLNGNAGNDILNGEAGSDVLKGGTGADMLNGGDSNDFLFGDEGLDQLFGGNGNDLLDGGAGADSLDGGQGNDILQGGAGADTLADANGNNLLDGGIGADSLTAGGANNIVIGGNGADNVTLGAGNDLVAFNRGNGDDVIHSAGGGTDTLSLGGGIDYANLAFQKLGNDLKLSMGNSDTILFKDWYADAATHSFVNLQMINEATGNYNPAGSDTTRDNKVERFDFQQLVDRFDQARQADPLLNRWSLMNSLLDSYMGGDDDAALGGDFAYRYGMDGTLAGIGFDPAQALLANGQLINPQALTPVASLQTGSQRLS